MPKNLLYKYRCKELLCNLIVRSDKWQEHCVKKHKVKVNRGTEILKEITHYRDEKKQWQKYVPVDKADRE